MTFSIYNNVCRSLYEKDKLIFAFLLAINLLRGRKLLNTEEYAFFFSPKKTLDISIKSPMPEYFSHETWNSVINLSKISKFFSNLPEKLANQF